jgi:hypothetical protein
MTIKTRPIIKGNTVYEINIATGRPRRIIHGIDKYFRMVAEEESKRKPYEEQELEYYEEINEEPEEERISPSERRKQLLKLVGNKKKLVQKADGLDREIPIEETEHEIIIKKKPINSRYRKKKVSKKPKRKVKKCRCK